MRRCQQDPVAIRTEPPILIHDPRKLFWNLGQVFLKGGHNITWLESKLGWSGLKAMTTAERVVVTRIIFMRYFARYFKLVYTQVV